MNTKTPAAMVSIVLALLLALAGCRNKQEGQNPADNLGPPGTTRVAPQPGGADVVELGDHVWVEYTGKLADGTVFDSSVGKPPLDFVVGTVGRGGMIRGFDVGVVGMKIGESKTLTIPPEDAYGRTGEHPLAGKTLTFQVKIIRLVKGR